MPTNTTRSVNTIAILDEPTPKFIAKSMKEIKGVGNLFLDYIPPKPKVVDEALESFKNLIKNCTTRDTLHSN